MEIKNPTYIVKDDIRYCKLDKECVYKSSKNVCDYFDTDLAAYYLYNTGEEPIPTCAEGESR